MGAILSEAQIAAVDDTMSPIPGLFVRDLSGQGDRIARLMTINAEQRLQIEKLKGLLHEQQHLTALLQAQVTALQAKDARYPLDAYGVARLAKNLPDQISLARVALAIGSKAADLGNLQARDFCDDAFDALDPSGSAEPEPMDWSAAERERGEL